MTHVDHFLAEPSSHLPARRPGSIRRTSHVDMIRRSDGLLELRGAAVQGAESATCLAVVGTDRTLRSLDLVPGLPGLDNLLGLLVGRGFRSAVDALSRPGTLPSVLLSELPVATLLSGYASLYTGEFPDPIPDAVLAGFPVDICAGWAAPASFMVEIRDTRTMPTPNGPTAPDLGSGWHPMPALDPGSMRRQRLIERNGTEVWAMFRDTYARTDGRVTVLHEYVVTATLDGGDGGEGDGGDGGEGDGGDGADGGGSTDGDGGDGARTVSCVATPTVLPWAECPSAAGSAHRMEGRRVNELRTMVKEEMVGTSTCTHLNDLLSSLSQADQLVESPRAGQAR